MTVLVSYNILNLFVVGAGAYIFGMMFVEGSDIAMTGGRVWGKGMFCVLTGTMMFFGIIQLPFLVPLLAFHLHLCWLTWTTGEFHSSYMFTIDHRTGLLRGEGAFLDVRARHTLEYLAHFHFMDQAPAFTIWKDAVTYQKHLRQSNFVV